MQFDPSVFGPIAQLAVFSATGDQIGYAIVNGQQLEVHFSSPSAGIGQLPGLPVIEVSVPVLASAKAGATSLVTATATLPWTDPVGNQYAVTVNPGMLTAGGTLSVESVTPGGGLLPAGTVVQVSGTGFDSGSTATIDGVSISNVDVAGPSQINLTLGGAAEMSGKHLSVTNSDGARVDDYIAPPSAPADPQDLESDGLAGIQPILPMDTFSTAEMGDPLIRASCCWGLAIFNPNRTPVSVTLEGFASPSNANQLLFVNTYTVPPGQLNLVDITQALSQLDLSGQLWIEISQPVRFIHVERFESGDLPPGAEDVILYYPNVPMGPAPPLQVAFRALPPSVSLTVSAMQGAANQPAGSTGNMTAASSGGTLQIDAPPPAFTLPAGTPAQMGAASFIGFREFDAALTTVQSSVSWLSATILSAGPVPPANIALYPNAVGLSPGNYSGTLTIDSSNYPPLVVPVTLTVIGNPNAQTMLTATPVSLSFTAPAGGGSAAQTLSIGYNNGPVEFKILGSPAWLAFAPVSNFDEAAPAYSVEASAMNLPPGTYSASLTVNWTTGSLIVPITFSVTATSSFPPVMTQIVSAASALPGAISPGEIISIFGSGIGPSPAGLQIDSSGKVATLLAQTQALIGGVACPLTYVSASQVNAIVPFEAGTSGTATVQVISNSFSSAVWEVPLAPAIPAIFAANASGVGQAAALNQDNSVNGPSLPAARGSVIQIFATGGGQTEPQAVDGGVAAPGGMLAQSATVTIGGVNATVQFVGPAPGEVGGVVQVNAVIPQGIAPGAAVPVTLRIRVRGVANRIDHRR